MLPKNKLFTLNTFFEAMGKIQQVSCYDAPTILRLCNFSLFFNAHSLCQQLHTFQTINTLHTFQTLHQTNIHFLNERLLAIYTP